MLLELRMMFSSSHETILLFFLSAYYEKVGASSLVCFLFPVLAAHDHIATPGWSSIRLETRRQPNFRRRILS